MELKDKAKKKLTAEELQAFTDARKGLKYNLNYKDGRDYAIPKLFGLRQILIDKESMGAEDFTIGYSTFMPGEYHEKHAHKDAEEFMFVISGRVISGFVVDGKEIEIVSEPGDVTFFPRGVPHWFWNPFDEEMTHIFGYTRSGLSESGYSLESDGFKEIGDQVEKDMSWREKNKDEMK